MTKTTYTPEQRKARLDDAHAELTSAIEAIATGDQWRAFLDFSRSLPTYSAQNRMWLYRQSLQREWDDLGHVAGFRTWLSLDRHVRKGEKGLRVLAPCRYKVRDDDGTEHYVVRGFTIATVFAARQTDGEGAIPEPIRPELLTGEGPAGAWSALTTLVEASGFTVTRAPLFPANGTTSPLTHQVIVADRLDDAAAVKTLAHELAHVLLHLGPDCDYHANRARCEVEAESVAFLVCRELGLSTDQYSFPYVASWASGEIAVVKGAADRALSCAASILEQLQGVEPVREEVAA